MNTTGRYVPWASWDEWLHTYRCLYPHSGEDGSEGASRRASKRRIVQALDTIDAWRLRGRVPMAVEATGTLKRLELLDDAEDEGEKDTDTDKGKDTNKNKNKNADVQSLRLQYSLAIVRFVNGVADAGQKGRVAASVASLAHQAGLSRLLVDIRHESTHNELPTLRVLRLGARQALEWLRHRYWEAQRVGVASGRSKVMRVVGAYVGSLMMAEEHAWKSESEKKDGGAGRDAGSGGIGGSGGGGGGPRGKRKKRDDRGGRDGRDGDEEDVENVEDAYMPRKEKKRRHALLNELRGLVPVGGEDVLARGVLQTAVEYSGPEKAKISVCGRVIEQLCEVWPDLAAAVVVAWLDDAFARCNRSSSMGSMATMATMATIGDGDGGQGHRSAQGICWYLGARSILSDASIVSAVESCIRRHCEALYDTHSNAYVEIKADASLQAAVTSLRDTLEDAMSSASSAASTAVVQTFIAAFLPATRLPVSREELEDMRGFVDTWLGTSTTKSTAGSSNGSMKPAKPNTSGWSLVEEAEWRPCAIGLLPSDHLVNGALPHMPCFPSRGGDGFGSDNATDDLTIDALEAGADEPSAATGLGTETGCAGGPSDDDENDGEGEADDDADLLRPPPDFLL